jgi:hypothetical protein
MADEGACAGLCFFDDRIFYAVDSAPHSGDIGHIGTIDFNFSLIEALYSAQPAGIETLHKGVHKLINRFNIKRLNVLQYPQFECWATLPKRVYDDAGERETYINILMNGMRRKKIHAAWYSLSNRDFKLLRLQPEHAVNSIKRLINGFEHAEFLSVFEVDEKWIAHFDSGSSGLVIGRFGDCISVCSFILGNLRAATYIHFDDLNDLPYLWLQKAKDLPWMQGLHDHIFLTGCRTQPVIDMLKPFWDESGIITQLNTLEKMRVRAEEQTYSFDLGMAYPAIMLALN